MPREFHAVGLEVGGGDFFAIGKVVMGRDGLTIFIGDQAGCSEMIIVEEHQLEGAFHDEDVTFRNGLCGGIGEVEFYLVGAGRVCCGVGEVVAYLHGGAPLCVVFCDDGTTRAVLNQCFRVDFGFGGAVNFDDAEVADAVSGEVGA